MTDTPGDTIYLFGEPRVIVRRFLVTYPIAETRAERKARVKRRKLEPSFSYTVLVVANKNSAP